MSRDAVVVGINTYNYERLKDLTAPAQDAEAISRVLEEYGEFTVKRLPGIKDKQNDKIKVGQKTEVSFTQLEEAIVQLFKPEGRNIPDTALLYFSGHGLRRNKGIQEGFLATSDTNPDTNNWGLRLKWLRELLQESEVKQQIIWLDCCYSGELLNFDEANPGNTGKFRDRCFIAASREFEAAYQTIDSKYSVLTDALLQGLNSVQCLGWVTNYTVIGTLKEHLDAFPQRPIFVNYGGFINLTRAGEVVRKESRNEVATDICPYRGLRYFDCNEEDAKYFYGREALTDDLLEKVHLGNFLAVLGASGSGKSSVVRAGLLYQLAQGRRLSGSDTWQVRIFRPDKHPLRSLAQAFLDEELSVIQRASQLAMAEELIAKGAVGLEQLVNVANTERVVLVVDQFEEVFTLCKDSEEQQQFFECLLGALQRSGNKLCLIITMRADFFGKCTEQEYSGLSQKIEENLVTVKPMTEKELKKVIVQPAKQVNLEIEAELVTQMLADVAESPGSLPLLQYTLTELWEQRSNNKLTLTVYTRLGRVNGTLQKRATEVYEGLSSDEQKIAKRIFLELTQLGEGTEDTRRRVFLKDLIPSQIVEAGNIVSQQNVEQIIQKLADAKLIVTSTLIDKETEANTIAVVDVAHEALIRHWLLLRKWLDENRDKLRQKRKIEAAAQEWLDAGKEKDYLFRGVRRAEAEEFQKENAIDFPLSELAKDFIFESKVNRTGENFDNFRITNSEIHTFIFSNVYINKLYFEKVDLTRAMWIQCNFNNAYFDNETSIYNTNFINSNLIKAYFNKCDISNPNIIGSSFIRSFIDYSEISQNNMGINLSGCDLSSINLSKCELSGIVISQVNLSKANLYEINLKGTNLSESNLSEANLNKADLNGANLSQADLSKANLCDANLHGANLENSNLSDAKFNKAELVAAQFNGANLQSAEFNDANIMGCDFKGVMNLTPKQVKVAKNWEYAQYDEDFSQELGLTKDTRAYLS